MKNPKPLGPRVKRPVLAFVLVLLVLFLLSSVLAVFLTLDGLPASGNVAVVPVKGVLSADQSGSFFSDGKSSSSVIVPLIEEACSNPLYEAVVLEINSPGGTPVASDEIAEAVKRCPLPTVAWIRETGASGAYWVASAADHIVAHPMSVTGSIGVYGSYLDFSGVLERYNASYQRLVAGDFKDAGSPFRSLRKSEEKVLQAKLDRIHVLFIQEVAQNRNLTFEEVERVSDGMYLLGEEAYAAGLVDELGGKAEVEAYLWDKYNISASFVVLEQEVGFFDLFAGVLAEHGFAVGQGLASSVVQPGVLRT